MTAEPFRLRVDPTACDGVGLCMHLAPSVVRADSWGFPIVDDRPLRGRARRTAESAIRACPRAALSKKS